MAGDKRRHVALCSQGPASAVTSLQLIFPLVSSCNYTFRSQEKKRNLGQVVHPLPWGPIPGGQAAISFSPFFPLPQRATPVSSVVMKMLRAQS